MACDALLGIEDFSTPTDTGSQCEVPTDCPGGGDTCFTRACNGGACEVSASPANQPVSSQVQGDCKVVLCNADSTTRDEADPSDPANDGLECTVDGCNGTDPVQTAAAPNTPCSGGVCDGLGACVECIGTGPCSGAEVCIANTCVSATCGDGLFNGDETDKDCGGGCPRCEVGKLCESGDDCQSQVCDTTCQAPSCGDQVKNGGETDVDCGGPNAACDRCDHGLKCKVTNVPSDCQSLVCACPEGNPGCLQPVCQVATCGDGVKNGSELAPDCGEACGPQCGTGDPCVDDSWCFSGVCDTSGSPGSCDEASCTDQTKNGDEVGIDCGGTVSACPACT